MLASSPSSEPNSQPQPQPRPQPIKNADGADVPSSADPDQRARWLHGAVGRAVVAARRSDHDLAVLLAEMRDTRAYQRLGYSSLVAYAEIEHDLPARKTRALVSIGRGLPERPHLDEALREGRIGWTKAREITRIITPATEEEWVRRATEVTSRQLEAEVSDAVVGDKPTPGPAPEPKGPSRVKLVFSLESADAVVLRDALAMVRGKADDPNITDGAILAAMAQRLIHEADPGEAPSCERYMKVIKTCPACRRSWNPDNEVGETITHEAGCDGVVVDLDPGPRRGVLMHSIPARTRRVVLARDHKRCIVPGCRCRLWVDLHHLKSRSLGGDHSEGNLVTLCAVHHRLAHEGVLAVFRADESTVHVVFPNGRQHGVQIPIGGSRRSRGSPRR